MFNSKCHIAIIDDGVHNDYYTFPPLKNNLKVQKDQIIEYSSQSASSHGTVCAAIIGQYFPGANISSIKILNDKSLKGCCSDLGLAIKWCIHNEVDIINLSLGTILKRDFILMKDVLKEAIKHEITIVAAESNKSHFTYPACLTGVIGVRDNAAFSPGDFILKWYPLDGIDILTSSRHLLKKKDGTFKKLLGSNSFATPYIAAKVGKLISTYGRMSKEHILLYLEKEASLVYGSHISGFSIDNMMYEEEEIELVNEQINLKQIGYKGNYNKYFWKYDVYREVTEHQIPYIYSSINIPIIKVTGSVEKQIVSFTRIIEKKFLQDNVEVRVVSSFITGFIYGFEIVPIGQDLMNFVRVIECKYIPEAIIVCSNEPVECDVNISVSETDIKITIGENKVHSVEEKDVFSLMCEYLYQ